MMIRGTLYSVLLTLLIAAPALVPMLFGPGGPGTTSLDPTVGEPVRPMTVAERLEDFGPTARARLVPALREAGLSYPPARLRLAAFKADGRLDLYAADAAGDDLRFVKSYDMTAGPQPTPASLAGPKLREGDRRVPEGLYRLGYLNPNSVAHVAIKIGYPNRFDRARAIDDGRDPETLGGDIMLHGPATGTEGCLALSDTAMEELFTLLADARDAAKARDGAGHLPADILIAPRDFRIAQMDDAAIREAAVGDDLPAWTPLLYRDIDAALARLPAAEPERAFRTWLAADE